MVDEVLEKAKRDGMDMYGRAMKNNGRVLLPVRYCKGDPKKDALYDAAEWLVAEGYARWIDSAMAPGIALTGRHGA